ncbi:MAG: alginate export family protein [Bryobacteraceae bacterium]|nr:alginate export family protein [Bryobacteraceae bacterium]
MSRVCQLPAQSTAARPTPGVVRWTEDYSFLRDPAKRTDPLDGFKFVSLNKTGSAYATFGAEYRVETEWFRNEDWGSDPEKPNQNYFLHRFMPYADLHLNRRVRFFTTLKFNFVNGRSGRPRPVDQDKGDIHEAFVDLKLLETKSRSLVLRTGRQELTYGQGLLINNREGPNVRQSFDAATLTFRRKNLRVDTFAARPVQTNRGWFDDSPEHRQILAGLYATVARRLDIFWLYTDQKLRRWQRGAGRDQRQSIGARWAERRGGWIYDYEGAWQTGTFRDSTPIRAWGVATETGYEFDLAGKPHLALRANLSSGDRGGENLSNFLVPYPKGGYWGKVLLNGPFNFSDLHPLLEFRPHAKWRVESGWVWFFRTSTRDAVYGVGGQLLRNGLGSQARFIGQQGSTEIIWNRDRHVRVSLGYSVFLPGQFLRETPPGKAVHFLNLGITYRL